MLDEICSNDIECDSGNCFKENERDKNGLCKISTLETQEEKEKKNEVKKMKKKSYLEIMTGLIIFIFILLIFCYFFFSIKKSVKNKTDIFMEGYNKVINKMKK